MTNFFSYIFSVLIPFPKFLFCWVQQCHFVEVRGCQQLLEARKGRQSCHTTSNFFVTHFSPPLSHVHQALGEGAQCFTSQHDAGVAADWLFWPCGPDCSMTTADEFTPVLHRLIGIVVFLFISVKNSLFPSASQVNFLFHFAVTDCTGNLFGCRLAF